MKQALPIFDGLGRPIKLKKQIRYTFRDHGFYMTALKDGEKEEVKPELPDEEWEYRQKHPVKIWKAGQEK
ncbi:hypothetical protein [Lacticaseibacillus paracasei]|jgi:hypothetical protein|uniref:hypothetical protein n=1 Tax=Lacticaseibacillus paracasei TaxID=1597 RepID=UPI0021A68617|nr:hypothetical protein [Lacticaseibacillus paracasei]UWP78197.1 hypothetical protein KZR06_15330 [Lacticaseibacillus paracasei]